MAKKKVAKKVAKSASAKKTEQETEQQIPPEVSELNNIARDVRRVALTEDMMPRRGKIVVSIERLAAAILKSSGVNAKKAERELKAKEQAAAKRDKKKAAIAVLKTKMDALQADLDKEGMAH